MKQYCGRDYGGLREALDDSGQNAVLVAPTLGDHSEAGRLLQHGQLDALLSAALAATRDLFAIEPQTTLRNFYLAAHSGGGSPMRSLAGGADNGLANLQECWSLDAANNFVDEAFWPGWAKARSADLGYFYFRRTDDESDGAAPRARDRRGGSAQSRDPAGANGEAHVRSGDALAGARRKGARPGAEGRPDRVTQTGPSPRSRTALSSGSGPA